jgi:hypothetical protein
MAIPRFTAERSLYRASEPYYMVADKNIQSDEQSIIPQQGTGWFCTGCFCCYYVSGFQRYCEWRC